MTAKKFHDWQTVRGTDDVMRMVDALERTDIQWCAICGALQKFSTVARPAVSVMFPTRQ